MGPQAHELSAVEKGPSGLARVITNLAAKIKTMVEIRQLRPSPRDFHSSPYAPW
jgi:hypothetical protein